MTEAHTQPRDRKPPDSTVTLTSKMVSSQKVRPEAAAVSLPALAGVGQEEENREKVTCLHPTTRTLLPPSREESKQDRRFTNTQAIFLGKHGSSALGH